MFEEGEQIIGTLSIEAFFGASENVVEKSFEKFHIFRRRKITTRFSHNFSLKSFKQSGRGIYFLPG